MRLCKSLHIKEIEMDRRVPRMSEMRNASRVLVTKPEGNRPLGRPRRRLEYNI